jgi:negative regulator of flagellin synthesis FlgM
MKVQGPPRPLALRDTERVKPPKEARSETSVREHVQVSSSSKLLAQAREPLLPDSARVERLKQAIADGSFEVDAEKIAEGMMKEELQ